MADDEDTEHTHDDEGNGDKDDLPPETEERIVDKVVAKVKDVLSDFMGPAGGGGAGEEPPADKPAGPAATEADMERQVRDGVAKEITAREKRSEAAERRRAHDEEHEKLRNLVETPPKTYSRLTSALWGSDDS